MNSDPITQTQNFGLARGDTPLLTSRESIPLIRLGNEGIHILSRDEYRFYVEMGLWATEYHANWNI